MALSVTWIDCPALSWMLCEPMGAPNWYSVIVPGADILPWPLFVTVNVTELASGVKHCPLIEMIGFSPVACAPRSDTCSVAASVTCWVGASVWAWVGGTSVGGTAVGGTDVGVSPAAWVATSVATSVAG